MARAITEYDCDATNAATFNLARLSDSHCYRSIIDYPESGLKQREGMPDEGMSRITEEASCTSPCVDQNRTDLSSEIFAMLFARMEERAYLRLM